MRIIANLIYDLKMIVLVNYYLFVKRAVIVSDGKHISLPFHPSHLGKDNLSICVECKGITMIKKECFSLLGFWNDLRRFKFWK